MPCDDFSDFLAIYKQAMPAFMGKLMFVFQVGSPVTDEAVKHVFAGKYPCDAKGVLFENCLKKYPITRLLSELLP